MSKAYLEREELLNDPSHEKKILSTLNRAKKALDEIIGLGYTIYVSEHGHFNVMNVEKVPYLVNMDYYYEQIVGSMCVQRGLDAGAW